MAAFKIVTTIQHHVGLTLRTRLSTGPELFQLVVVYEAPILSWISAHTQSFPPPDIHQGSTSPVWSRSRELESVCLGDSVRKC